MKRIVAIDILRGFALLGILLLNSISFAMPGIAYYNPLAFSGDGFFNRTAYTLVHIFGEQKFMALFSMLFGASVMLLINSLERKGQKVARFHFTRNAWLFIFGLLHGILIWEGDILTVYALCSFVLYFFRKMAPKRQFGLGMLIFMLPALGYVAGPPLLAGVEAADFAALEAYWQPADAEISAEIDFYRGAYLPQVIDRLAGDEIASPAFDIYYSVLLFEFFTRAFGMMLVGMALYSWGVLTAQRDDQLYRRMLLGLPAGIVIAALGVWWNFSAEFTLTQGAFTGRIPNLIATPLVALGYIGLIMLWSRSERGKGMQQRLAATGRTALTNYIGQSMIGTAIFYGFGLGLFGSVNRAALLLVVMLIWAVQLAISPIWLRHFRYGPLEWLWRSLSYWQVQPLRRQANLTRVGHHP